MQARVVALALDLVVGPGERLARVVRDVLIELLVLLVRDFGLADASRAPCLIDGLVFERGFAFLAA